MATSAVVLDTESPALAEILSLHGLDESDLDRECLRQDRNEIAVKLQDWEMIGYVLDFPPEKLKDIERENQTQESRKVVLLEAWGRREGKKATYMRLARVLCRRQRCDLVEFLCERLSARKSTMAPAVCVSSIGEGTPSCETCTGTEQQIRMYSEGCRDEVPDKIDDLERRFRELHDRLISAIVSSDVSVSDVLQSLTKLPLAIKHTYDCAIQEMLPNLERRETIHKLFLRLNPLFTFIDYELLKHLISSFGDTFLKKDMNGYIDEMKVFKRETTVGDLIEFWPGHKINEENDVLVYSRLKIKFGGDPKTYTLERLDKFRRKFCNELKLSECISVFILKLLESASSFYATWLVPSLIASGIAKAVTRVDSGFYLSERVVHVLLDERSLYITESAKSKFVTAVESERGLDILEFKPDLSELQCVVKPLIANRWEEVGTALGLADDDDGEKLDRIQENRNGDCGLCFNDTMILWLRSNSPSYPVTWATLINAIKSIDELKAAGAQIEAQVLSTKELYEELETEEFPPPIPSSPRPAHTPLHVQNEPDDIIIDEDIYEDTDDYRQHFIESSVHSAPPPALPYRNPSHSAPPPALPGRKSPKIDTISVPLLPPRNPLRSKNTSPTLPPKDESQQYETSRPKAKTPTWTPDVEGEEIYGDVVPAGNDQDNRIEETYDDIVVSEIEQAYTYVTATKPATSEPEPITKEHYEDVVSAGAQEPQEDYVLTEPCYVDIDTPFPTQTIVHLSKPKLSDLQKYIRPRVAEKWEELAIALGLSDDDDGERLDNIRKVKNEDCNLCFNEAMKLWLRTAGSTAGPAVSRTWSALFTAMKNVSGLEAIGAQVETQFLAEIQSNPPKTSSTSQSHTVSDTPTPTCATSSVVRDPEMASISPFTDQALTAEQKQDSTFTPLPNKETTTQSSHAKDEHQVTYSTSVKLGKGQEIRSYQWELAEPGINGENYIVVAPTGSGKTLVAALVISDHLEKNVRNKQKPKVVFIVNTKPLVEQQQKELGRFIPGVHVYCSIGDTRGTAVFDLLPHNDVIVCTAGKLLDAIKKRKLTFDMISLVVIDECHHTKKGSPQANVMLRYLEEKERNASKVPQIMGLTASPVAGDNPHLDEKKTIDHFVGLCALMDATRGIVTVEKNVDELDRITNKPSFTLEIPQCRNPSEPFIQTVVRDMENFEKFVPNFKCSFHKWSQEYQTTIQQLKQPLELSTNPEFRDQISTLGLLRCYSQALNMYMDLSHDDAITVLEEYTGLPADDFQATPHERELKESLRMLQMHLKLVEQVENPLLNAVKEKLADVFSQNPSSKGIVFVRTKKHALSICRWIKSLSVLVEQYGIKPRVLTGHTRETGHGMTQVEQEEVMKSFREGVCNLLVATSVAEEGLDVPACNLVIRFQHVSNEIAKTQTQGRARAEESEGFTILSSDSRKKLQELKNEELLRLFEECMQWFPRGPHLVSQIKTRQKLILMHHRQKISIRKKMVSMHDRSDFLLRCKSCKILACGGSDVYLIDNTNHHAVPDEAFKKKIKTRPHHKPRSLTQDIVQTHKIFCLNCDSEWGIMATWPAKGKVFPVLKCKRFIFETNGQPRSIGKWSDAPFELADLSVWFDIQNQSDESGSE